MAKRSSKRVRHLTVVLLKHDIRRFKDALKDAGALTLYKLRDELPFRGRLYVQVPRRHPPKWLDFVRSGVEGRLDDLVNASASAVLFVRSGNRRFAFTFGYGRNLLKPESFERDFGLKVALNRIDPDSMRSMDMRTFEDITVHTRRQASRGATLDTFGLNASQDVLRAVTGKPTDDAFARQLTGADALAFSVQLDFAELGTKCKELLRAYQDTSYKARFAFIDHLRGVRDPKKIADLQDRLLNALRSKTTDQLHLAPPEPLDWERVEAFVYMNDSDEDYADLDVDDYLTTVDDVSALTIADLRAHRIGVRFVGASQPHEQWSLYQSIVLETELGDRLFVLSAGDWFEVAKTFAANVGKRLQGIAASNLRLPKAGEGETEGTYNERVAAAKRFALMDGANVRASQANTDIEVCDLFTPDRQFVHVKRKTRSATLSHLFAQGVISAEAFLWDEVFRKAARAKIRAAKASLARLVPETRPAPSDFEVVYAIVTKMKASRWPLALPFFSKLNLVNAADRLTRLGYEVSLLRVPESS